MVKIYNYDDDGIFTHAEEALIDPLESKKQAKPVCLMPANATSKAVKECGDNEVNKFVEGDWVVVKDYRGLKEVDLETQEISEVTEIGDLRANHYVISEAQIDELNSYTKALAVDGKLVIKKSLPEFKAFKRAEINQARDMAEQGGFGYLEKVFDSDTIAVQRMTLADNAALKSKMAGLPFSVEWTVKDNSKIELNTEQMLGMLPALTVYGNMLHIKASDLKTAIDSAQTVEELEAVVW